MPRPRQAPLSRRATVVFAWEWAGLGAVAALDAALMAGTGLRLSATWRDGVFLGLSLLAMAGLRAFHCRRAAMIAEYLALNIAATTLFCVFTYLCMAISGPYADAGLMALDRALGFDWLAGFRIVHGHPWLWRAMCLLYRSILVQALYFSVLFGLLERPDRMREIFRILSVSLLITGALAALWPALGPFKTFGLERFGDFLPAAEQLHAGKDLHFRLDQLTGVICFPSFHTTLALTYAYGLRRTGAIGHIALGLNLAMLFSVPFVGGHYLTDMIAGAGVMLVSLALVRRGAGRARAWIPAADRAA